ncbi:MAG TPA: type II secretion system protein GspG [Gemmataceae bacterium]|jgi:general secretion pathway protein G
MVLRPLHPTRTANRAAFTLLEVLIVVAIIVVLAGVSSIYVFRYLEDAKEQRVKADVKTLEKAAQAYELKIGQLPNSLTELVQPPDGGKPYVESESIMDPWGKQYQYDAGGGRNGGQKPDVWTTTPDGRQIGNWPGGR